MHNYFMKMKADNSDFFFALDLDDEGRLRNVFWVDARSRAACKEFGDVVTFDTTYLVNRHDMPFALFVGVNHHGQSVLLGCGLISHEDTESFSGLFKTWKTCMWDCAPKAIITDQCMAMKNAIEDIFPNTRHRWCIWHIMKKIPEKLNGCNAYENISWCMRRAVYASLTIKQFEDAWDVFIKKYELQSNTWLEGLYLERKRWVPAYLNDVFWAGMSSTQRSENINAYFDGYVHSKTILKQFVGQYENALGNKVESENQADAKSWNTFIPLMTEDELEKQFQSVYTHAKVKEFQKQIFDKIHCFCDKPAKVDDIGSEHEINEWVTYGEGEEKKRIQMAFTVNFNAETNETHCNCRLFESRGMVCKHQLFVWHQKGIERVSDKYVLRRWCKNVKRIHTKVRICYDKSSTSIEARRHDNMCNIFNEVADLAEESQEKYDMVMKRVHELKRELMEASVDCESNVVSLGDDTGIRKSSFSLGDGVIPPKQSTSILDPEGLRRKGRPPCKRKISAVEKVVTKKRQISKKPLSNEKSNEVEEIAVSHHIGTQESIVNVNGHPSYMGHSMWPNMMPHPMRPNMAQGGSIFPFSPTLCPTGTSLNQFMPSFPSSQSLLNGQVWMGQSIIAGSEGWGGGQSGILEAQGQYWGGPQPSMLESQWQGCGGQQSYMQMMNAPDNVEE
ncbi:protein FAR-RED IMPAIRED RESPONSE 1-like [Rhododendron vialii]|uniref:protein FAR-RED IMPAIRED RESPONSE 1-like n=1 Tax=Rhododendron vialii TaxID=182163 RepID=UPI00265E3F83|nr:protein FAR-RED IMPAIRED RESPONSE 1-like [Rhododendron vialii]